MVDTVVTAPAPGTPEYDTAMLAKAGNVTLNIEGQSIVNEPVVTPAPTVDAIKWPDYLPEKFRDAALGLDGSLAKMAKSYGELEKARSTPAPKVDAPVVTPEATALAAADKAAADATAVAAALPDTDPGKAAAVAAAQVAADAATAAKATSDTAAAKAATAAAGVDYEALQGEFAEKGELSAETYDKLIASGIPRGMIDSYIAGQVAIAADIQATGFKLAGGTAETYAAMADWMKVNVPASEIEKYNEMVAGDKANMTVAITGMYARYTEKNGFNPQNLEQGGNRPAVGGVYASMQQMQADMRDPRYAKDPAFRAMVEAKAAASTAF